MSLSKQVRVALCGTHGVGKTTIVNLLEEELTKLGYKVAVISGTTRKFIPFFEERSWRLELLSSVERHMQELVLSRDEEIDVVLSERMGIDELAYSSYFDRKPELKTVLRDIARSELTEFWDSVYYKPIHPDYPLEEDGVRPQSQQMQTEVDQLIVSEIEWLGEPNIFETKADIYEAKEHLRDAILLSLRSKVEQ